MSYPVGRQSIAWRQGAMPITIEILRQTKLVVKHLNGHGKKMRHKYLRTTLSDTCVITCRMWMKQGRTVKLDNSSILLFSQSCIVAFNYTHNLVGV